jgi:hypothetical protein
MLNNLNIADQNVLQLDNLYEQEKQLHGPQSPQTINALINLRDALINNYKLYIKIGSTLKFLTPDKQRYFKNLEMQSTNPQDIANISSVAASWDKMIQDVTQIMQETTESIRELQQYNL